MPTLQRTTQLRLRDDDPKTLGVRINGGTLISDDGLVEGVDYEIVDPGAGTIRRLRALNDEQVYSFTCKYEGVML